MRYWIIILASIVAALVRCADAQAAEPATMCAGLLAPATALKFAEIADAPTTIVSAKVIPAGGNGTKVEADLPEICRVEGQISPNIGFLLRMPTKTWNGKFLMGGCGGPCGNFTYGRDDVVLARNYAVVSTDMGHKGPGWMFIYHNLEAMVDFGYRSTHVTAVAAKAIIETYYGKKASRNYFWGCSTGGRQAMVEAQRFPKDFEGIVAGAPVWNQTGNQPLFSLWATRINIGSDGRPILDAAKLELVHKAVIEACDAADGLKDGILQDPRRCDWDPKRIQCQSGESANCLTSAEANVVRKIYEGASTSDGQRLYWGMMRGSEDQWKSWLGVGDKPAAALGDASGKNNVVGYRSFFYAPGPSYSLFDFNYDVDPARLALTEIMFNAQNPDLRKMRETGAKLILYAGWNDNNIPPEAAVDYYQTATRALGGPTATLPFFRLFLLPAVNHCQYGLGGGEADWLGALEAWVERQEAPDAIVVYHMRQEPYPSFGKSNDGDEPRTLNPRFPLNAASYDRSRPVFAYPGVARYAGKGDANLATSWTKTLPRQP